MVVASPTFSKSCALPGSALSGLKHTMKDITEYVPSSYSVGFDRSKPMNLNYEFSLLNYSDRLRVEAQDAMERIFTVSTSTSKNQLVLNVKFPANYPNQTAPIFSFLEGTTIDNVSRNNILQKLRIAAKQQTSRNRLENLTQFRHCIQNLSRVHEGPVAATLSLPPPFENCIG